MDPTVTYYVTTWVGASSAEGWVFAHLIPLLYAASATRIVQGIMRCYA